MNKLRVLVACEFSGIVREAFSKLGHDAWSCDFLDTEIPGNHYKCNVLDILDKDWDLMIAHPPCTYLSNSGARHLHSGVTSKNGVRAKIHGEKRMEEMRKAANFFNQLLNSDIPRVCVENPVPHKYAKEIIGQYSQLIRPWQFGNPENRATCLWLKNLPLLKPTNIIEQRINKIHMTPDTKERWKRRSRTLQEIADALADQFGVF